MNFFTEHIHEALEAQKRESLQDIVRWLQPEVNRMVDARMAEWLIRRETRDSTLVTTGQLAAMVGYTPQGILKKRRLREIRASMRSEGTYLFDVRMLLKELTRGRWKNAAKVERIFREWLINN